MLLKALFILACIITFVVLAFGLVFWIVIMLENHFWKRDPHEKP